MDGAPSVVAGAHCSALELDILPEDSASQCDVPPAPKPKPAPKKPAKPKAKASPGSGQMACELCEQAFPMSDFPHNQNKCYSCKQDWDSLSRMCKRQQQAKWWNDLLASPLQKKRKVWKTFRAKYRAVVCPVAKKQFNLLTMVESFKVTSATDAIDSGKMMWKDLRCKYQLTVSAWGRGLNTICPL